MSYDVDIGDFSANMTSNISGVFYDHMDGGIPSLDGLTGKQASERLEGFWKRIERTRLSMWGRDIVGEPSMCRKYDAENGWGSLVGALIFAGNITSACASRPRHKVRVWY